MVNKGRGKTFSTCSLWFEESSWCSLVKSKRGKLDLQVCVINRT